MRLIIGLGVLLTLVCFMIIGTVGDAKSDIVNLHGDNTVVIDGYLEPAMADNVIAALWAKRTTLPATQVLYVVLHTPGGRVDAAYILESVLKDVHNIQVICTYCASAAGHMFLTTTAPRLVHRDSTLMMHEMFMPHVTAKDVRNTSEMKAFLEDSDQFDAAIYSVLKVSKADYLSKIEGKEWDMREAEMVQKGIAKSITIVCDDYIIAVAPDTCR